MTMLSEAMTGVLESDPENNTVKRKSVGDIEVLDVLNCLVNEAERTLKIREILSQLETQPAGSE